MTGLTTWERWLANLPARDKDEAARYREYGASGSAPPARPRSVTGIARRALPRPLLLALYAVLFAAAAVISAVRWWHGEPLWLRVFLCACYGCAAALSAAAAAWPRTRDGDAS